MLHVSDFKNNLLFVTKLVKDNQYKVNFFNGFCTIISTLNVEVKGVGKSKNGLYYLKNELVEETLSELKKVLNATVNPFSITDIHQLGKTEL